MQPTFFETPEQLRAWMDENHATAPELWVGLHKKASGLASITWAEAVDQALCFGWIDGLAKSLDDSSWAIRLTPRRRRSNWSAVNIRRVGVLSDLGLMRAAGLAAFRARSEERSEVYSYERRNQGLGPEYEQELKAHPKAWAFFQEQPPWYRRATSGWVMSAKQEATRRRRLAQLIAYSEKGATVPPLTRRMRKGSG